MSYRVIKASEIGEYVYCNRAWWLRRNYDVQLQNVRELKAGTVYHEEHGGQLRQAALIKRLALVFLFLAVSILVFWVLSQMI
jgi:hypothetical protein